MFAQVLTLFFIFVVTFGAQPEVKCPVPTSPANGRIFLSRLGTSVKYSCNLGFRLKGSQIAICKDKSWFPETPTCEPIETVKTEEAVNSTEDETEQLSSPTSRPLFTWNNEVSSKDKNEDKDMIQNDMEANNDTMQGDEARIQMILYPRRRLVASPVKLQSASKLEEEEKKRSSTKQQSSSPSFLYVRPYWPSYYRAPMHLVLNKDEESIQDNNEVQQYYWEPSYRRNAIFRYRTGYPVSMTLSESQLAWINSLHPEVRDRYLKDLYDMKSNEVEYVAYEHDYPWVSRNPYFTRQPLAMVSEDPVSTFDYSCHRTERDGRVITIRAPKLTNAYIYKYDRRKNPYHPYNDYLAAQYRCKVGFALLDSNANELYCSRSSWVGNQPICVQKM